MIKNIFKSLIILTICLTTISCSYQPIFNPNQKYKTVGEEVAQSDFKTCEEEADKYLAESKKRRMAKEGFRKAAWWGIFGSIFGFIFGGNTQSLLTGAAIGAGTGAAFGAGGVAAEGKLKPDQIKRRYVTNCLGQKGYEILGWE